MRKLHYTNHGVKIDSDSMEEELFVSEVLEEANISEKVRGWHWLITRSDKDVKQHNYVKALGNWGFDVTDGVEGFQRILTAQKKRYAWDRHSLKEIDDSPQYKRALQMVMDKYGVGLPDGRQLFEYQIDAAAKIIAKKRLLLGLEMGLGKTLTTLVALTADPANKKILIVTMSRNINDWVREVEALGYVDDYIVVESPSDLQSNKRISIVSYEKWSMERIMYRKKEHESCPNCGANKRFWRANLQYCTLCKTKSEPSEERYSSSDTPDKCPSCRKDYGANTACKSCGDSIIEHRKPALYRYFNNSFDAAAVDEIHYIKNLSSKRSLAVRAIRTKVRVGLSGTPSENGAVELYAPLLWITGARSRFENPLTNDLYKPFGNASFENFREYFGGGAKRSVLDTDSIQARVSHHHELWDLLDSLMIRKRKLDEDVKDAISVPKPEHYRMHLDMQPAEKELYEKFVEDFRTWYEEELYKKEAANARGDKYLISTINICQWLDKLRKAASCPWLYEEFDAVKSGGTTAKLDFLKNKALNYVRRGKKLLIFSSHKSTVEQLAMLLNGIGGAEANYIHGSVKKEYRWELMERFQEPNDKLSILVISVKTGAESYTLTEAKAVFLYDLDYNAKKLEQCYSRAVRLGQKDVVDIYWLINSHTIDANIHGLVLSKKSGVDLAVDREELDFSEVAKEFKGSGVSTPTSFDFESFAADMLKSGTSRSEIVG